MGELDRAAGRVSRAKTRDGSEPLGEWQHKELHQAAADLAAMSKGLSRAADQAAGIVFAGIASDLTQVADGPLRDAAEAATCADIESDDWKQRNEAIAKAHAAIQTARDALRKLLESSDIERLGGMSESARDLKSAAKLLQTRQTDLARTRLEQAFHESPFLRERNLADATMRQAAQAAQAAEKLQQADDSNRAAGELQLAASAMGTALAMASRPNPNNFSSVAPQAIARGISSDQHAGSISSGPVPAAVRDLGLSADDWARLPPLARRDLLNTAQQSPPAAYRQMVRDYFVKLARMHDASGVQQ
jgi:hypothetical protein